MVNAFGGNPDADYVVGRLRGLLGRGSVADDYVRLRIDVLRAQAAALAELEGSTGPTPSRLPLAPEMVPLDAAVTERLFRAVAEACRRHGDPGPDLGRLESAVQLDAQLLEELLRHAAFAPLEEPLTSLGQRLEVSVELLWFVGRLLVAPPVSWAARRATGQDSASPQSGPSCPVCGATPGLASLRPDDGARLLHCSLCAHRWRFARLDCPFCATEEEPSLVRLTVAGEEARWIEACDRCKRYLKVVDRRQPTHKKAPDFIPLVEEVAGLCLDLVAEKEGYRSGPPYAALG